MLNATLINRLILSLIGITSISSVIWFVSPLISINNIAPFKSETVRIIAIALLCLVWLFLQLILYLYQAWNNKKAINQKQPEQSNAGDDKSKPSQYTVLSEHFSESLRLLKNAHLYHLNATDKLNKYKPGWWPVFSRQYLYQLPWYVVIGAPRSGKTTLLMNSGLHFPLAEHLDNFTSHNIKGVSNCDWWFTNNAVLLDTTGRYATQDNQHDLDAGEWKYFIKLLRKYRTRQPINGIMLTISVEDLLNSSKKARDQQAYLVRRRLAELHEQLKIQFPIYVIVTKVDLLKGFEAYFNGFDKTQCHQIWGFNFPWNQTNWSLNDVFAQHYTLLQKRLEAELPPILLRLNDPRLCAESYLFPQEFATLQSPLVQYLEIAFAQSRFDVPCLLRGLYFTSATQEGESFDPVMEKLNHHLQLPTDNNSHSLSWRNHQADGNNASQAHPPVTHAYFLKNLLENIFQEAGLTSQNRWWIYRNRLLHRLGYTVVVALIGLMVAWFLTSYTRNQDYLRKVQSEMSTLSHQHSVVLKKSDNDNQFDFYAYLPILNTLADLVDLRKSDDFFYHQFPLLNPIVLPYSEHIHGACVSLYQKALQDLLQPQVAQIITAQVSQIQQDNSDDWSNDAHSDDNYQAMKAYLMLYSDENRAYHYDGSFLYEWMKSYLKKQVSPNARKAQQDQIYRHLNQLFFHTIIKPTYLYNEQLAKEKKKLLSQITPEKFDYLYITKKLANDPDLLPVNLAYITNNEDAVLYSFIENISGNQNIPSIFTAAGYKKFLNKLNNINNINRERYALLSPYIKQSASENIAISVLNIYFKAYIKAWDKLLLHIHSPQDKDYSLEELADIADALRSKTSFLRKLILDIADNITLIEKQDNNQPNKIKGFVHRQVSSLTQLEPNQLSQAEIQRAMEQNLKMHFLPFVELAKSVDAKQQDNIVFDNTVGKLLNDFSQYLRYSVKQEKPLDPSNKAITQLQSKGDNLPVPLKNIIASLVAAASKNIMHKNFEYLENNSEMEKIASLCQHTIADRYPLTPAAHNDIRPQDMAQFFNLMDDFFQKNLAGRVDNTQENWHFFPGEIDEKLRSESEGFLKPFQSIDKLRSLFFKSQTPLPSIEIIASTIKMDNNILSMTMDVDGQIIQYSHGPKVPKLLTWPGPKGTNQIHIQLNLADGTTTSLTLSGAWALLRLVALDKKPTIRSDAENNIIHQVTLNIHGHSVVLELNPNSVYSPFKLPHFTCPKYRVIKE